MVLLRQGPRLRCNEAKMPDRYRTIVADPPWCYEKHGSHGRRIQVLSTPYAMLSVDEIKALPVAAIADENARLFLWATSRYLRDAFDIAVAWGFPNYAQTLVWHKTGNPSPLTGGIAPIHAEFLLVASRGRPGLLGKLASSVIAAPKPIREHSRKPDVFLDLVEQVSPGPYLELFARRARFGWDYWGNESLSTVELVA